MKFSLGTIFELKQLLKELGTGLSRLDLTENFQSFEVELEIPDQSQTTLLESSGDFKIRNQLAFIPSRMIIVKQVGNGLVTAGDTAWTSDFLYVRNNDSNETATTKIIFMK